MFNILFILILLLYHSLANKENPDITIVHGRHKYTDGGSCSCVG